MNKEHTRPFCLEHARAGAPYACRDGRKAEVLKWDCTGRSPLIGFIETEHEGTIAYEWREDGRVQFDDLYFRDLVMTPLVIVDEKPVFVGDEMEVLHGGLWNKFKVEVRGIPVIEIDEAKIPYKIRWPTPESETSLSAKELWKIYNECVLLSDGGTLSMMRTVANAAIRRYLQDQERAK